MLLGSQSLVASLQLQLLWERPFVVEAAALLTSGYSPSHIGNYAPGVSIPCRLAATTLGKTLCRLWSHIYLVKQMLQWV